MSIKSAIANWLLDGAPTKAYGPSVLTRTGFNQGSSPRPSVHNMEQYLGRYADQAWVYACISVLASKGAGVPLKIYRKKADGQAEELPNHPLKVLVDSANPLMNGYDLMEATIGYKGLAGNAYWLLDAFVNGKPTEVYPLNPQYVKVKADRDKGIVGYIYEPVPGQVKKFLDVAEVLHFKSWNPLDPFYGLAPISAARDASDSMMHADRYNKAFFENSAEPGGILTTEATISNPDTRERIRQIWKKTHQGSRKAHEIAILEGGLKWQSTATTQRDMQFPELKHMTREDILAVYHIPPIMVGVFSGDDSADAREQRKIFWIDTMVPELRKVESVVNERLVKPYDPNVFAAFDLTGIEELQEDKRTKAEEDEILTRSGIKLINEVRKERKLEAVPYGDTWNAPISLMPIETHEIPDPVAPPPDEPPTATDDPVPEPPKDDGKSKREITVKVHVDAVALAEMKAKIRREGLWQVFKGHTEGAERRWRPALRTLFTQQEKEVLRNLRDDGWEKRAQQLRLVGLKDVKQSIDVILFNRGEARKAFRKDGRRLLQATLETAAKAEVAKYDLATFSVVDPRVQKWLDEKAFKFADEVNDATEAELRKALTEAITAGDTIVDVEKRIEKVFDMARGYRTERIARTEVVSASNQGAFSAYEQSGVVQETEWITARDADVRESHQIDGQERGLGKEFSNGLLYPGDPNGGADEVINCRCTIAPVIKRRTQ